MVFASDLPSRQRMPANQALDDDRGSRRQDAKGGLRVKGRGTIY